MLKRFLGRRSPIAKVIHFSSVKCGALRYCESKLEYNRLLRLEFDPTVAYYEAQPDPFGYKRDDDRVFRYTPDVLIVEHGGYSYFEEIKPYEEYVKPDVRRKYAIIRSHLEDMGHEFRMVHEHDIYVGEMIPNYRRLYRFLGEPLDDELLARFRELLPSFHCTLLQLRQRLKELRFPSNSLNLLMAHGHIQFDHENKIDNQSEVYNHERII